MLAAVLLLQATGAAQALRFDRCIPGTLPAGWTVAMTHKGGVPRWEVVLDASSSGSRHVFGQVSEDKTAGRFPLAIWDAASLQDGEISVAFKPVKGVVDQAAGIVWRYQDPNNYYIVRANALENNVVLYKLANGIRASIAPKGLPSKSYGVKHQIPSGVWMTLRVAFKDSLFTVFLDGQRLFEAEDRTFSRAGKTGLWTKADSVTYFDAFEVAGK